jgi:hypothetical protein
MKTSVSQSTTRSWTRASSWTSCTTTPRVKKKTTRISTAPTTDSCHLPLTTMSLRARNKWRRLIRRRYTWVEGMLRRDKWWHRVEGGNSNTVGSRRMLRARGSRMRGCDRYLGGHSHLGVMAAIPLLVVTLSNRIHFHPNNSSSMQQERMSGPCVLYSVEKKNWMWGN